MITEAVKMEISTYQKIYNIVRKIPAGRVMTYGQIAGIVDRCSARMVGYAMAALKEGTDVPWHRVVNSRGMVSLQEYAGRDLQYELLKTEGVRFSQNGVIDLSVYRWENGDP
ncbi:MAG: MGMT family protein [Calditrichaceae bacterium]|nr:MGMT family protein [Calditrichaceae bacterium]